MSKGNDSLVQQLIIIYINQAPPFTLLSPVSNLKRICSQKLWPHKRGGR